MNYFSCAGAMLCQLVVSLVLLYSFSCVDQILNKQKTIHLPNQTQAKINQQTNWTKKLRTQTLTLWGHSFVCQRWNYFTEILVFYFCRTEQFSKSVLLTMKQLKNHCKDSYTSCIVPGRDHLTIFSHCSSAFLAPSWVLA